MKKNVMIVAHTDDELLWGWKDLINEKNWLVICVFQQYNFHNADIERERRIKAFEFTSKKFNFDYEIFNFEDNPNNLDIDYEKQNIISEKIMSYIPIEYDKILTHNPDGEYGHYHHKIVSKIVTNMNIDKDKLNYFSFNKNRPDNFDECYKECFNKYFIGALNDETVIGHKELSKIVESVNYLNYKYDFNLIKDKYPKVFFNCGIIKNKNYI